MKKNITFDSTFKDYSKNVNDKNIKYVKKVKVKNKVLKELIKDLIKPLQ